CRRSSFAAGRTQGRSNVWGLRTRRASRMRLRARRPSWAATHRSAWLKLRPYSSPRFMWTANLSKESEMEVKELGHIVLYVRSLERSRHFYRDVLGWKEVAQMGTVGAAFSSGRTHHELLLLEVGEDATPIPEGRR